MNCANCNYSSQGTTKWAQTVVLEGQTVVLEGQTVVLEGQTVVLEGQSVWHLLCCGNISTSTLTLKPKMAYQFDLGVMNLCQVL